MKTIKILLALFFVPFISSAQFGEIRGIVTDRSTGQVMVGATVSYYIGGTLNGVTTDDKGEYKIKPLVAGKYDIEASYVMYKKQKVEGIDVNANKATYFNFSIDYDNGLPEIVIRWKPPIIDPEEPGSMVILTPDQIEHSTVRSVQDLVASHAGVYQKEEGGSLNVRGSRDNATVYVVDGIRMMGGFSLPKSAIAEITVLTGGIPAQFGDATGGVILITTKSFSR